MTSIADRDELVAQVNAAIVNRSWKQVNDALQALTIAYAELQDVLADALVELRVAQEEIAAWQIMEDES